MPYRPKGRSNWFASFTDARGKRVRRSTGTASFKEAKALEAKWKAEVHRETKWGEKPRRTVVEVLTVFLKATQARASHQRDLFSAARIREHFTGTIQDIAAEDVADYKKNRGVADGTLARELGLLSRAIEHCNRELDWQLPNPVKGRIPPEHNSRLRWLTRDEAQRLIQAAEAGRSPYLADFIRLALYTGMRRGEIFGLEWKRVQLARSRILLEPKHQKGRTFSAVPLTRPAVALLRRLYNPDATYVFDNDGKPLTTLKTAFRVACRRAGLTDLRIHDLRHTTAAWMVQDGVPLRDVSEVLRHKDIRTTMRYAHLAPDSAQRAISTLDKYDFGGDEMVTVKRQKVAGDGLC